MNWIQKNRTGILTAVIALLALAAIVITKPAPAAPSASRADRGPSAGQAGSLFAEETSYDFGAVPLTGGLVRNVYRVKNAGSDPVTVKDISTSCMCTSAIFRKGTDAWGPFGMPGHGARRSISVTLAPGESAEVEAIFDPAAHGPAGVGPVARAIYLAPDRGDPVELSFTALVTP